MCLFLSTCWSSTLFAQIQLSTDISGESTNDQSGYSVSLDGNRVAIGAPLNDGNRSNAGIWSFTFVPDVPTNLQATACNAQVALTWTAPTNTNRPAISINVAS